MNERFEEKKGKTQNCEISHIDRSTLEPRVYKESQTYLFYQCVEHRVFKVTWAKLCGTAVSGGRVCTRLHGRFVRARTRVYTAARPFRADACVHGRVDVSGGRVCTQPCGCLRADACGRFADLYDRMQLKARHATKSRGMQLKVDMQCNIGEENQQRARYMSIFPV